MKTLWAPWRLEYIADPEKRPPGCFLCAAHSATGQEREHLVLARSEHAFVIMNRYPYSNAHLMVVPGRHVGGVEDLNDQEGRDIWQLLATCKAVLAEAVCAGGCNIGINQGRVAGAGVLDHVHVHVVPRWEGDTNFMPVMADVRVMPQALEASFDRLRPAFAERGF